MAASSSSKVTVEYHDPSGVFPLIQSQLIPRLPLRNLHWKSPTRPLRSIDSLHIDLVPSQESPEDWLKSPQPSRPASVVNEASNRDPATSAAPANAAEAPDAPEPVRPPAKERRHQIPGLRQTPYLKVFLLRCDDSDSYKSSQRKLLREWVRAHTPPSQSSTSSASTQENHDAFEWLIVHVVLPNTPAAKQPRWSSSSGEKSSSTTRWPGRGSTTLFEKIRADFNVPGKAAADRVAQVRLQKTDIPPGLQAANPGGSPTPDGEGPQEINSAWNDAITKFKTLILMSFDLRVGQYEEDIREKDLQRTLPGWNFCTFFVLKEGLARGFESVGLVEDALVGYDELSYGLDSIIREEAANGSGSNAFLESTEDLKQQLLRAKEQGPASQGKPNAAKRLSEQNFGDKPISSGRKNYRELILSNNISVFDFRCYIFSRQMSLLLRLGNAQVSKSEFLNSRPKTAEQSKKSTDDLFIGLRGNAGDDDGEDLTSLADLCQRTMSFITSIARIMRADLVKGTADSPGVFPASLVDNFVSSWSFAVAQQILKDTVASSLPVSMFEKSAEGLNPSKLLSGGRKHDAKNPNSDQKTVPLPRRTTSLLDRRASVAGSPYGQTGQVVYENGKYNSAGQLGRKDGDQSSSGRTGLLELAAHRAELYLVQRRILERLGKANDWTVGWAAVAAQGMGHGNLTEISLDEPSPNKAQEEEDGEKPDVTPEKHATIGVFNSTLRMALSGFEEFRGFYEQLSDLAVKHYFAANRPKSAEGVLGDLAAVKFETGDYAAAAMYFSRMAPIYARDKWNLVEIAMLKMHAQCLQKLHRKDEYVRVLLDLLTKSAANRKTFRNSRKRLSMFAATDAPWLNDDNLDTSGYLKELVNFSDELPYEVNVPMSRYFSDIAVMPHIDLYEAEKKDGFKIQLRFRHLLEDEIFIEKARVHLASITTGENKEITLESSEPFDLKQGLISVWLGCNVVTFGQYIVEKIALETRKVSFVHETTKKEETLASLGITVPSTQPASWIPRKSRILVYPRADAFDAKISTTRSIQIDKPKALDLECNSFGNNILNAEIRLKAASAGLRLRTGDAVVAEGNSSISDRPSPGVLSLSQIATGEMTRIRIPYELETTHQDLHIKLEITYHTAEGEFEFRSNCIINIELPLDVNVHDVFQETSLYSRFNISTSSHIPLDLINIKLEESAAFAVGDLPMLDPYYPVLPKEPTAFSCQISKKEGADLSNIPESNLALILDYRCLDDQVFDKVEGLFSEALRESSFARFIRLLVPVLRRKLEERITPKEWKRISIRETLELGSFEELGWQDTIDSLPEPTQTTLRQWLQVWHEQNPTIDISPPQDRAAAITAPTARRIIITVGVPRMPVVHTASLDISSTIPTPKYTPSIAALGSPLPASLRIKHTRQWDHPSSLANLLAADPTAPLDFVYELDADPEVWLVGGQRRAHFSAMEGEELTFPILLVPLKEGCYGLPGVRVMPAAKAGAGAGAGAAAAAPELSWELDLHSRWTKVMVVSNWKSVTVGLEGFGEDGGGSVLLETKLRGEGVGV